jgi:hypothetical protein
LVAAAAIIAVFIVFVIRHRTTRAERKTKPRVTMDPALVESLPTPTASPEVKGTFDQKSRDLIVPTPSPPLD